MNALLVNKLPPKTLGHVACWEIKKKNVARHTHSQTKLKARSKNS